jgi:hypothetical protein
MLNHQCIEDIADGQDFMICIESIGYGQGCFSG